MKRAAGLLLMLAVVFCGFVGVVLVGRVLLLAWQWALIALPFPAGVTNTLAIGLTLLTVFAAVQAFKRWGPRRGPTLDA